jgi:hypothetical protein
VVGDPWVAAGHGEKRCPFSGVFAAGVSHLVESLFETMRMKTDKDSKFALQSYPLTLAILRQDNTVRSSLQSSNRVGRRQFWEIVRCEHAARNIIAR